MVENTVMPSLNNATLTFHHDGRDYSIDFPSMQAASDWWGNRDSFDATVATKLSLDEANSMFEREARTEG